MKQITLFLFAALLPLALVSCDNDDSDPVSNEVKRAFTEKYPSAKNVSWENKGGYNVADFRNSNAEASAWFDKNGIWYMTETDLPFNALPQAVKDSFQVSQYATWQIDDVDMLERKDTETVYVIEVESQNNERDLYYSTEGILIRTIVDNNNTDYENQLPKPTPTTIETFIKEKYPQARIIEIEHENGRVEVDIIHDNLGKEVVFDTNNQWLHTSWDVRASTLPQAVANIVNNAQYAGYRIDDADFVETLQANYYLLELEKGNSELKVKVDKDGKILN